ncbi:MAG: hypothetical protein WCI73_03765 [Phycisphaerae bacterium]
MDAAQHDRSSIDYQAAATRLLVVLCAFAQKHPNTPIPAARLARPVFGELAVNWQHETRRRRIRDAATIARDLLAQHRMAGNVELIKRSLEVTDPGRVVTPELRQEAQAVAGDLLAWEPSQICANGQGYWYSGDAAIMAHYASQRRRRAVRQLAQVGTFKTPIAEAAGQTSLFSPASLLPSVQPRYRH